VDWIVLPVISGYKEVVSSMQHDHIGVGSASNLPLNNL